MDPVQHHKQIGTLKPNGCMSVAKWLLLVVYVVSPIRTFRGAPALVQPFAFNKVTLLFPFPEVPAVPNSANKRYNTCSS
jgi:hypothetical protein